MKLPKHYRNFPTAFPLLGGPKIPTSRSHAVVRADRRHQAGKSANDAVLTGSMGLGRRIITAAMGLVSRRTCALQVRLAAACPTQALLGLSEKKMPRQLLL
ncbi:hypothetical protein OUZ56_010827 [Daphnia magna]|uniref:Uncharacterized protein n=1 Tax=Daphnia magna TaxID=35525 RepID=A0ABQ9YYL9_9CRUS|nr:hypothetical protein OUZ56_010827 [Daphnia magna]